MICKFENFVSKISWSSAMTDAARFASQLPSNRVITITVSLERSSDWSAGMVTVWYWA